MLPGAWRRLLGLAVVIVVLPVGGWMLAGRPIAPLLEFPPSLEIPADYPGFSWIVAGAIAAAILLVLSTFSFGCRVPMRSEAKQIAGGGFPEWGWLAVAWTLLWWALAWWRPAVLGELNRHTFFPLWLGLIVTLNALTVARTGSCGMLRSLRQWLVLFGVSAAFWWGFEWLNRFVRNWHYLGVEDYGAIAYALHATICFSTVLPAVSGMAELLLSFSIFRRWERGRSWPRAGKARQWGTVLMLVGVLALVTTGSFPLQLYPALWVAPLFLAIGFGLRGNWPGFWWRTADGNWRRPVAWALAALACGFFWELWNWQSLPKWIYTVPYVDRWHLFEMPLLGYAGYLPFGLECLVIHDLLAGEDGK